MWRPGLVLILALVGGCDTRGTCPAGDLACLSAAFSINDFETYDDTSKRDKLTDLTAPLPAITTSPKLSISVQGALNFPSADVGQLLFFTWTDANGCRPSLCMNHCPRGVRCVTGGRCTQSRPDGLTRATTQHWIEYDKDPAADEQFDLVVTPVSATGCPVDVAALIEVNDASVAFGPPLVIPVTLPAPGGEEGSGSGSGGTCGPDLEVSTLSCTPIGSGGAASYCLTDAEYRGIFGTARPSQCAPQGTAGCMDTQKGALVKPCCPGLTCRVGSACGGGSATGGVCAP